MLYVVVKTYDIFHGLLVEKKWGSCNETHQALYDIPVLSFKINHKMSQISADYNFSHYISMNKKNGEKTPVIVYINFKSF